MFQITLAIAKGRMQTETMDLLRAADVRLADADLKSRRLVLTTADARFRFIFVKPADVPVYVEHGVADCGICGADVLFELNADVMQPLDLRIAGCRLCVALPVDNVGEVESEHARQAFQQRLTQQGMLRVATKYPRLARAHFSQRGIPVEIIELSGSVELAPLIGLSDCIVDLVETGRTLIDNGLSIVETITTSTARFIVNRASYHLKATEITDLIAKLENATPAPLPATGTPAPLPADGTRASLPATVDNTGRENQKP